MPGRADRVDKQLAGEVLEPEPRADFRAVDGHAARRVGQCQIPLGAGLALFVDEGQPQRDIRTAIAVPVVGGCHPGVQAPAAPVGDVAEEGVVGREVLRIEVALLVGLPVLWQPKFIECDDFHAIRYELRDVAQHFVRVEGNDQKVRCSG